MPRVHHTLRLPSPERYGAAAPPAPVGALLHHVAPAVRESILMRFQGRSRPPGRPPAWLVASSDVRFVGLDAGDDGETLLHFEAPRLGDAAEELYRQAEFWPTRPPAKDTGFDLLGDVIGDVADFREDSERFDLPLLRRLIRFRRVLDRGYERVVLAGDRFPDDCPAVLDFQAIENARRLDVETPPPQRVRVVGLLDMVRVSRQAFELRLDDGTPARGVLVEGDITEAMKLGGRRVLVQGRAVYRPSGRPLRIDADLIRPSDDPPDGFWSKIPAPRRRRLDVRDYRKPQGPRGGVNAFFGAWPGDETDEEWNAIVEGLS